MGKKLSIKGHPTRGNEVIELLEMLGGINDREYIGTNTWKDEYYFLDNGYIRAYDWCDGIKFTLEGFWKKYPYKVGDKVVYEDDNDIVVISEIIWDDTVGDIFYNVKRIDEDDCFLCPPELLKPYKETNMNKKLAIKGHSTRGNEVIEILKMMGGNSFNSLMENTRPNRVYYIGNNNAITWKDIYSDNSCLETEHFFTLEEFLEKYPFKVGDKVNVLFKSYIDENEYCKSTTTEVKSMRWNETLGKVAYKVKYCSSEFYAEQLKPYKETNMNENKFPSFEPMFKMNDELEYKIPEGYEITEVSKDTVFIKPIKPQYPKTYKECCDVLGLNTMDNDAEGYKADLIISFQELLIARDAYWKIAGEQMGLGKPWAPDWNWREHKFCIGIVYDEIVKFHAGSQNCMLAFPTEEMRDAFYDNFKDLIEQSKKFL